MQGGNPPGGPDPGGDLGGGDLGGDPGGDLGGDAGGPEPIPYPDVNTGSDTDVGSKDVDLGDGGEIDTHIETTGGEPAGPQGGFSRHHDGPSAVFTLSPGSVDVKIEGTQVPRMGDPTSLDPSSASGSTDSSSTSTTSDEADDSSTSGEKGKEPSEEEGSSFWDPGSRGPDGDDGDGPLADGGLGPIPLAVDEFDTELDGFDPTEGLDDEAMKSWDSDLDTKDTFAADHFDDGFDLDLG